MPRSKTPALVINIGLCLVSVLITLLIAEVALRFTQFDCSFMDLKGYYSKNEAMGYDITPDWPRVRHCYAGTSSPIWSNELGCFDTPYRGEKDYVLLVGDSFTWGYAPFELKWGTLIEKSLGVRTLKCGVIGFGARAEQIKVQQVVGKLGVTPHLIVVGYWLWDDLEDDILFPKRTVGRGYLLNKVSLDPDTLEPRITGDEELFEQARRFEDYCFPGIVPQVPLERVKCFLYRHSTLYKATYRRLGDLLLKIAPLRELMLSQGIITLGEPPRSLNLALRPLDGAPVLKEAWRRHARTIRDMKTLADEHGAGLMFVLIPAKEQVYDDIPFDRTANDLSRPARLLGEIFEREGIAYLDLTPEFRRQAAQGRKLYWDGDPHFNIEGNRLTAEMVGGFIQREGLLGLR